MEADEAARVRRARCGDREAFAALADAHWDRVRRYALALTRHTQEAEDLAQETFVRAWAGIAALRDEYGFRFWLFRIARNLYLDGRKSPARTPPAPLPRAATARDLAPPEAAAEEEADRALRAACDRLPDTYRSAYVLWAFEGMGYPEIAAALGISGENVRWRVCKARAELMQQLEPYL